MMEQTLINFALATISALLGFLLNALWRAVRDLQSVDSHLADKVREIEVFVASNYVSKDELARIETKLDRIEAKLDRKVDRKDLHE